MNRDASNSRLFEGAAIDAVHAERSPFALSKAKGLTVKRFGVASARTDL